MIHAISIGQTAFLIAKSNNLGKIHSTFERTFNLRIGDTLINIAQSDIPRSPISIIIDIFPNRNMFSLGIEKGMPVRMARDWLLINNEIEIFLGNAKLWQPKTCVEKCVNLEIFERNLELAKSLIVNKKREEGVGQLSSGIGKILNGKFPLTSCLNPVAKVALPHIINLVKMIRSGELAGVKKVSQSLIGLGPGLTPSVDDMLTGFMVASWWFANSFDKNAIRIRKVNEAIISCANGTNLLSQQLLRHAARGETNETVEDFLKAIFVGKPTNVKVKTERVLEIGESSGMDMMAGLLLGLYLGLKMK
jgi:hypothetical protein